MNNNKYQLGKIYTIRHPDTDKFYIGSTCQKYLSTRFAKHKCKYYTNKNGEKSNILFALGFDDCYIELLENYPCNNKLELEKREGELIRLHKDNIVNKKIEGRTKKEYYEDTIEHIKIHKKEYYEDNKEYIKNKSQVYRNNNKDKLSDYFKKHYESTKEEKSLRGKEKIECECGSLISRNSICEHLKSQKHKKALLKEYLV
jgi:hypothetical protein